MAGQIQVQAEQSAQMFAFGSCIAFVKPLSKSDWCHTTQFGDLIQFIGYYWGQAYCGCSYLSDLTPILKYRARKKKGLQALTWIPDCLRKDMPTPWLSLTNTWYILSMFRLTSQNIQFFIPVTTDLLNIINKGYVYLTTYTCLRSYFFYQTQKQMYNLLTVAKALYSHRNCQFEFHHPWL